MLRSEICSLYNSNIILVIRGPILDAFDISLCEKHLTCLNLKESDY